ncbi:MAG TPA: spore coat protein [Clostridiales bacterium]|nr:spore coat protein [Clostridiales bacterium]
MANLTTKELSALEDQLGFEKVLCCKYQQAAQCLQDSELKQSCTQYANQHRNNYETLLGFLQ